MNRTNYIFIDFENVQETDLDRIANKPVKVTLVLGERHKSLPVALVKKLLKYSIQVALVETGRAGKNALDLVLAQHIGEAKKTDPHGYFHIVSKDKDFDALIGHLKDNGTLAARHAAFCEIPVLMNLAERVKRLTAHFKVNQTNRPKKRKTLESQTQVFFGKTLTSAEVEQTIQGLVAEKTIKLSDKGDVTFQTSVTQPVATPLPVVSKPKPQAKPKTPPVVAVGNDWAKQVLAHWRKPTATRPRNKKKLVSYLVAHLGHKITEAEALNLVETLSQAGHLFIDDKRKVFYHLDAG